MTNQRSDVDDLRAEIENLKSATPVAQRANLIVAAIVVISTAALFVIGAVIVLRPDEDHMPFVTLVLGLLVPLMTALGAGAMHQHHLAVNSRLTKLLELNGKLNYMLGEQAQKDAGERNF